MICPHCAHPCKQLPAQGSYDVDLRLPVQEDSIVEALWPSGGWQEHMDYETEVPVRS